MRILREEAKRESQVQRAKAACDQATADDHALIAELETRLTTFILSHQDLFQRPRKHRTTFGEFGLEKATRTHIGDADALMDHARNMGYTDLIRVKETPNKAAVTKRLKAGEKLPNCRIEEGDIAKYKIAKAILENIE